MDQNRALKHNKNGIEQNVIEQVNKIDQNIAMIQNGTQQNRIEQNRVEQSNKKDQNIIIIIQNGMQCNRVEYYKTETTMAQNITMKIENTNIQNTKQNIME